MNNESNRAGRVIKALISKYLIPSDGAVEESIEEVRMVFKGTNSRIRKNPDEDLSCA